MSFKRPLQLWKVNDIYKENFVNVERIQDLSFSNMADYTLKTLLLDQLEVWKEHINLKKMHS